MCSIATRGSANRLETAIHDVCVDVAFGWMKGSVRKAANGLKPEALPQPDGVFVGTDHEIVLHRAKSALARMVKRMRAHGTAHAAAGCFDGGHIAAICDVRAATL